MSFRFLILLQLSRPSLLKPHVCACTDIHPFLLTVSYHCDQKPLLVNFNLLKLVKTCIVHWPVLENVPLKECVLVFLDVSVRSIWSMVFCLSTFSFFFFLAMIYLPIMEIRVLNPLLLCISLSVSSFSSDICFIITKCFSARDQDVYAASSL